MKIKDLPLQNRPLHPRGYTHKGYENLSRGPEKFLKKFLLKAKGF